HRGPPHVLPSANAPGSTTPAARTAREPGPRYCPPPTPNASPCAEPNGQRPPPVPHHPPHCYQDGLAPPRPAPPAPPAAAAFRPSPSIHTSAFSSRPVVPCANRK